MGIHTIRISDTYSDAAANARNKRRQYLMDIVSCKYEIPFLRISEIR